MSRMDAVAGGGGMRGGGGGGPMRGNRISSGDPDAQRAMNAAAPKIPDLLGRIAGLFRPHRTAIIGTVVLVLLGAALSVIPPLLTQKAFDLGLFPGPDIPTCPCSDGSSRAWSRCGSRRRGSASGRPT